MQKALKKLGVEGIHLNITKAVDDKPTATIILNGEKRKPFPVNSGTRQGCPLSPLLLNTVVPAFIVRAIWQEKEYEKGCKQKRKSSHPIC
jgi:hypothetical protein